MVVPITSWEHDSLVSMWVWHVYRGWGWIQTKFSWLNTFLVRSSCVPRVGPAAHSWSLPCCCHLGPSVDFGPEILVMPPWNWIVRTYIRRISLPSFFFPRNLITNSINKLQLIIIESAITSQLPLNPCLLANISRWLIKKHLLFSNWKTSFSLPYVKWLVFV